MEREQGPEGVRGGDSSPVRRAEGKSLVAEYLDLVDRLQPYRDLANDPDDVGICRDLIDIAGRLEWLLNNVLGRSERAVHLDTSKQGMVCKNCDVFLSVSEWMDQIGANEPTAELLRLIQRFAVKHADCLPRNAIYAEIRGVLMSWRSEVRTRADVDGLASLLTLNVVRAVQDAREAQLGPTAAKLPEESGSDDDPIPFG